MSLCEENGAVLGCIYPPLLIPPQFLSKKNPSIAPTAINERCGKCGFKRATIFSTAIFICTRTVLSLNESNSAISFGFFPSSRASKKIRRHLSGNSSTARANNTSISCVIHCSSGDSAAPPSASNDTSSSETGATAPRLARYRPASRRTTTYKYASTFATSFKCERDCQTE